MTDTGTAAKTCTPITADSPAGSTSAQRRRGWSPSISSTSPSWVIVRDVPVTTFLGQVRVTVACGGAIYATLSSDTIVMSAASGGGVGKT
jgi:proline racemase